MLADLLTAGEHFALEVRGDSMIEAHIRDGDIAADPDAASRGTGDIVVALIDDEQVTLKRFRRRGASIASSRPIRLMRCASCRPTACVSRASWWGCLEGTSVLSPKFLGIFRAL